MKARILTSMLCLVVLSTSSWVLANPPPTAEVVSPAPAEPPPAESLPGSHPSKLAALVLGGVAVVGVGVGTAFGILALDNQSSFNAHPTYAAATSGNQEAVVADFSFGLAVVAGVTSVVLFFKDRRSADAVPSGHVPLAAALPAKPSPVTFTVSPIGNPHGGGASAVLRF